MVASRQVARFIQTTLALSLLGMANACRASDPVDQEWDSLLKRMHSKESRSAAEKQFRALKGNEAKALREARDFFYDLRARKILLAPKTYGSELRTTIATEHLDIFGMEDIPALFSAAWASLPRQLTVGNNALNGLTAQNLSRRTSEILGLEHRPLPGGRFLQAPAYSRKELQDWWLDAVRSAKIQPKSDSRLDRVLRYFEKLDAVPSKPADGQKVIPANTPLDQVDIAVADLLKRLRSQAGRELVKQRGPLLDKIEGRSAEEMKGTIDLFFDFQAKEVLLALLQADRPNAGSVKLYIAQTCLDILGIEDIPAFYVAICRAIQATGEASTGDPNVAMVMVDRLTRRTSAILGVEHVSLELPSADGKKLDKPLKGLSEADVRRWFVTALKKAKAQHKPGAELDRLLFYLENVDKDS